MFFFSKVHLIQTDMIAQAFLSFLQLMVIKIAADCSGFAQKQLEHLLMDIEQKIGGVVF